MGNSFWNCPICGAKHIIDERYENFIYTYNVLSQKIGEKQAKNICEKCGYVEAKDLKKYRILKITDHNNLPKRDSDSLRRIGKNGYLSNLAIGHSAIFIYEGESVEENKKAMVTSEVVEICRDYNESYFIVKTMNSVYTFVEFI